MIAPRVERRPVCFDASQPGRPNFIFFPFHVAAVARGQKKKMTDRMAVATPRWKSRRMVADRTRLACSFLCLSPSSIPCGGRQPGDEAQNTEATARRITGVNQVHSNKAPKSRTPFRAYPG